MDELRDIVTNVGAFAGFAAIVGLAVLAMLYFSQARDVRRLREWAGRAPEREAEVEQLAQQLASQAIADMWAAMPEDQAAIASAAPLGPEPTEAVTAVEGAGEQAEAAAEWSPDQPPAETSLPDAEEMAAAIAEDVGAGEAEMVEAAAAGEALAAEHVAGDDAEQEFAAEPEPDAELAAETAPEAAPAAAVSQPTEEVDMLGLTGEDLPVPTETRPSRLAPSTPAAARAARPPERTGPRMPLPPLDEYRSTAAESVGAGGYSATGGHTSETTFSDFERERNLEERRGSGSRVPFYVAGVLVLAFGVLLVYTQFAGDSEPAEKQQSAKQSEAERRKATGSNPRINRPAVQVVVLNGTQISGLAAVVGDQVDQAGFTLKSVANLGGEQDQIESVVYYAPGKKLEAEEVAKELQIDSVKEVDPETSAAGSDAPVIVVTGSDREQ